MHALIDLLDHLTPLSTLLTHTSASPVPADTVPAALKALGELKARFLDAEVVRPSLPPSHVKVEYLLVQVSSWQTAFHDHLCGVLRRLVGKVNAASEGAGLSPSLVDGRWAELRGDAREVRDREEVGDTLSLRWPLVPLSRSLIPALAIPLDAHPDRSA